MSIEIRKVRDLRAEIPEFSMHEKRLFKMKNSLQKAWERYLDEYKGLSLYYLEDNSKVIGLLGMTYEIVKKEASFKKVGEKLCFLMAIVVEDEYRGKGLGNKLMDLYIEEAKANGAASLALRVDPKNTGAISLYEKCGFKEYFKNEGSLYMQRRLLK